jgi:protein SCO1/2
MRGWALLAMSRVGVSDAALLFVLEELQTGMDAYLVAAAARALRAYPRPNASLAPFVIRAIGNIRYREEPVSFAEYGEYASATADTSPLRELLAALAWLGPHARDILAEIDALQSASGGLPRPFHADIRRITNALRNDTTAPAPGCCPLSARLQATITWPWRARRRADAVNQTMFEDHDGTRVTFGEYFRGRPAIVVFFYTRCDNPQKCSLTITKLARIQKMLEAQGLTGRVRTAAITYDPEYDDAARLRAYGINRGVRLDADHRLLRTTGGLEAVRAYFHLGVNYIRSLVNRHRLEVFVLDSQGRIAAAFERIHWSEAEVVARASECLLEGPLNDRGSRASAAFGILATLGLAFFPKCPACWAAYLSVLGIAGLERIPYAPWLIPLLAFLMLIALASAGYRAWTTRRYWPSLLVLAGMSMILGLRVGIGWEQAALPGVILTLIGLLGGVLFPRHERQPEKEPS